MSRKRVAITGLGAFCGIGRNVPEFTDALAEGRCGIGPIDLFDVSGFSAQIGCQVKGFDPLDFFDTRTARRLSRADQFGIISAGEALRDSGVREQYGPYQIGVSLGGGPPACIMPSPGSRRICRAYMSIRRC